MRLASLAVLLAALGGCAHRPVVGTVQTGGPVEGYPAHTLAQIRAAVAASVAPVQSVSADGSAHVRFGTGEQDATFSLRARLADSVTVVVRGPLGIEGGRGLATPDSFFAADRLNDRLYLGPVSAAEAFVPGAGSAEQVARALVGLLVPDTATDWTVAPVDGQYLLRATLADGSVRDLTVDPSIWRVVRVHDRDRAGGTLALQECSAFDTVDGVVLPRRVRLQSEGVEATLEHRQLAVNPADLRLRFRRPTGYEVVPVE